MTGFVGKAVVRVDGRDKVTGKATYSAEWDLPGLLHAVMVTSPIGRGRIASIDVQAAERAPRVKLVLTHHNADPGGLSPITSRIATMVGGPMVPPDPTVAMMDDQIRYAGAPVALVVADTRERAVAAAALVKATYDREAPDVDMPAKLDAKYAPKKVREDPADSEEGDFDKGWADGEVKVDAHYTTAAEAHNPMEPHATIATYKDGKLTIYDSTQYVYGVKMLMALRLGIAPGNVRVVSRFVGGGFGSKGVPWPHVPLVSLASMRLERPVKFAMERRQMFGLVGFRPRTHNHMRIAAKRDGTITALGHEAVSQTSRFGEYIEPNAKMTQMMYAAGSRKISYRLVKLDTQTPTFQRAPGEAAGSIALECAMDELARALSMDPVQLRLKNYAETEPGKGRPWSSKELRNCYLQGAEAFGWNRPKRVPTRKHVKVGRGMATATYPTNVQGAAARVRVEMDGTALVQVATHDLGTGTYTILTQVAADALGLRMDQVRTEIGDSDYPHAPVAGGSQSAASCANPVHDAASAVRAKIIALALKQEDSPLFGAKEAELGWGDGKLYIMNDRARADAFADVLQRAGRQSVEESKETEPGKEHEKYAMHAWGAQFAEVEVDEELGMVRVTKLVGAFAAGRILNIKTTRSQLLGGMVMGVGMALLEEVRRDPRQGKVENASLEGYVVPVNADIPEIEVVLVQESDEHVNPRGIKGVGEIGIVGAAAAIANAIFDATGKRVREFPITIEKLL